LPGPLSPFADLATGRDGAVYVSADGEGSILRLSAA
jgi:glucose/arabinose dehydrogenase